jgi:hypothetical protein
MRFQISRHSRRVIYSCASKIIGVTSSGLFRSQDDHGLGIFSTRRPRTQTPLDHNPSADPDTCATHLNLWVFLGTSTLRSDPREAIAMSTPALQSFSAGRAKSYVYKLPLFTRLVLLILVATWAAGLVLGAKWDIQAWGALVPDEVGLSSRECCLPPKLSRTKENRMCMLCT